MIINFSLFYTFFVFININGPNKLKHNNIIEDNLDRMKNLIHHDVYTLKQ